VEVLDIRKRHDNGMSVADIAREVGYSEKTVRKWLKAEQPPRYPKRPNRPGKLDLYREYIMQRMAEGVFNCVVLLAEIRAQGYEGGYTILKEFVAPFRRQFQVQAVRRFETDPGQQVQVDWAYLGRFLLDGRWQKVWVFVMVLGYSRMMTAMCVTSMDLETLLLCHQLGFDRLGGVPREALYDNMKTVTTGRDGSGHPVWQRRFLEFALHYGFRPQVHRPYHPRSKGKVEKAVDYLKHNFCAGRTFTDLGDLNAQLQNWLDGVANIRVHGTTNERPIDRWSQEDLQPLPLRPFDVRVRFPRQVSRDGFCSYLGVLYSVPWPYAGGTVEVEERLGGAIRIWWHGQLIAEHTIPRDGRKRVFEPAHQAGLPAAQRRKQASGLRQCYPEVQQRPLAVYEALAGGAGG